MLEPDGFILYVAKCPKPDALFKPYFSLESRVWCDECGDWHDCEEVGDFHIQHLEDDTIKVHGYGYYEEI